MRLPLPLRKTDFSLVALIFNIVIVYINIIHYLSVNVKKYFLVLILSAIVDTIAAKSTSSSQHSPRQSTGRGKCRWGGRWRSRPPNGNRLYDRINMKSLGGQSTGDLNLLLYRVLCLGRTYGLGSAFHL